VPLCKRNSGAESGRQLFKGSKEAASLAAFTRKKICGFSASDVISGELLGHLWPTLQSKHKQELQLLNAL